MKESNAGRWFLAGTVAIILVGLTTDQIINNVYDSSNTALRATVINASGTPVSFATSTPLAFGTPGVLAVFAATELGQYPGAACTPPALALSQSAAGAWTCATPVPAASGYTLLVGAASAPVSTGSANDFPIIGVAAPNASTGASRVTGIAAGVLSNLICYIDTAPGVGKSYTFLLKDGAGTSTVTCAISGGSATTCTDVTHTYTVPSGISYFQYEVTPAGTPASATNATCSIRFTPS